MRSALLVVPILTANGGLSVRFQGVCWVLGFVFTLLLAYQTDTQRQFRAAEVQYPLSWWTVLAPLFVFQVIMACSLLLVLYYEFAAIYRLTRWQLGASVLYSLALVTGVTGELMLLKHLNYHWGTFTFPSGLIFFGLVCASVGMYIVGRHHVDELMATRGGAVPVPLTRTTDGWITSHAVVEQWVLFGDVYLTPEGLAARNQKALSSRRDSSVESSEAAGGRLMRRLKQCFGGGRSKEAFTASDPERRIQNLMRRTTSGSYSDITIEVLHTPKQ